MICACCQTSSTVVLAHLQSATGSGGDGVEVALDPQEIEEMGMDAATTAK